MRSKVARMALALLLTGCSVFNKPDPGHLDAALPDMGPDDMGMDAGPDMGPPDMGPPDVGMDAPDAWSCPGGDTETMCGDGADDDCDQLVDCADPDCVRAGAAECCNTGSSVFSESFESTSLSAARWAGTVSDGSLDGHSLGSFPLPPTIQAMVAQNVSGPLCLQPELGLRLTATFHAVACSDCSGSLDLVVGPTTRVVPGGTLQEDLAIRGTIVSGGALRLAVLAGPDERGHSMIPIGTAPVTVTIDLAPTVFDGTSYIGAHVAISSSGTPEVLVENLPVVQRDHLQRDFCGDNARGMFLGVQGSGTGVRLDQIDVTQSDCPGPTSFAPAGTAPLTQVTFGADGTTPGTGWASGGIGDPSLSRVRSDVGMPYEWLVLYDASSTFRSSEPFVSLPLSLGGGSRRGATSLPPDASSWIPRLGVAAGTAGMPFTRTMADHPMRDPSVGVGANGLLMNNPVVWAERVGPGETYGLMIGTLPYGTSGDIVGRSPVSITGETCTSLRSPLLLPRIGDPSNGWLLFYVCGDHRGEVHVATVTAGLTTITRIADASAVIGMGQLGASASLGVVDVAGAGWMYGGVPLYRLWLVTRSAAGASIAFVEGTVSASNPATASFTPFPGNPVLTADDPAFSRCPLQCEIHGISATRWPDMGSGNLVQLLVERWETTTTSTTYGLVPLTQRYPPGM